MEPSQALDRARTILEMASRPEGEENRLFPLEHREEIYREARRLRDSRFGRNLYIRASLEFSNHCAFTCGFCGMSRENRSLERYTLSWDQAGDAIRAARDNGIMQLHLVSGEGYAKDLEGALDLITNAVRLGMEVTVVMGARKPDDYQRLWDAGASRYIMKFEISDPTIFKAVKGGMNLEKRIAQLFILRDIGFLIGTGIIVGLPGGTPDILHRDLRVIELISPDMASASAFSPNADSAFHAVSPGESLLVLDFIALMRIRLERTRYISSSTSLPGHMALKAGANVASVHITPEMYADRFSMYRSENRIISRVEDLGRTAREYGLQTAPYIGLDSRRPVLL